MSSDARAAKRTARRPSSLGALALCAGLVVWSRPTRGQTVRLGPEFQVNTYTTSYQYVAKVAKDGAGNFVVVWESYRQDGSKHGIFGQRFSGAGVPQGAEFRVNTYTPSYQTSPSVSADTAGNFVVVWQSYRQDGSYYGVFGQRYNSTGVAQGTEFKVNANTAYDQNGPAVSKDGSGNFVVVWNDDDGFGNGVFAQRYDAGGVAQGSPFRVNTYTTSTQDYPVVGKDGSGNFVVAWQSYLQDASAQGAFGQRLLSTGSKSGVEFQASTYVTGAQMAPSIAVASTGSFVVVWESPQDGGSVGVFGQRYTSAGVKVAGEFQVNTYTTGDQRAASLAVDGSGNFVVVWQSFGQDGSLYGIFGQRYNSAGTRRGSEFRVNTTTASSQLGPSVAMDSAGDFVVVWHSFGQDGDGFGVFGQRFSFADCAALSTSAPASVTDCQGGTATFSTAATGTGPFTYQWRKGGANLSNGSFVHGATSASLKITQLSLVDAGNYDCVVTDYCLPPATLASSAASLTVTGASYPAAVSTLSVQRTGGGASLRFTWTGAAGANDYVVLEDAAPGGSFATITGSSPDGATGLTIPMPPGTRYYLAAGRNACGIGPKE